MPASSKQRTLALATARLGPCLRLRGHMRRRRGPRAGTRFGRGRDMPVSELDIETLASDDGARRAYAAPILIAHKGKATLQGTLIAERAQQLGQTVEPSAPPVAVGQPCAGEAARTHLETLTRPLQHHQQQRWRQAADD